MMKKISVFAVMTLAALALSSSLFAVTHNSSLVVTPSDATSTKWTFTLTNNDAGVVIKYFEVGLLVDDTVQGIGNLNSGHLFGYGASINNGLSDATVKNETSFSAIWSGFALNSGQSASFWFNTDLTGSDYTTHLVRGVLVNTTKSYNLSWDDQLTPVLDPVPATVPEPAGFLALFCGCVGLCARFRKSKSGFGM